MIINLHILQQLMEKRSGGLPVPFSIKFVSKEGKIISMHNVVMTSAHGKGGTINIKQLDSGEIRKIRKVLIIEFNERKVRML